MSTEEPERNIEDLIGPSGYPGEHEFIITLPDGNLYSWLSGMHTIDTNLIDWTLLPKLYKSAIAIEVGDKTWLPKIVSEPELGVVFVDVDEEDQWYWVGMKAKQNEEGKWITDKVTAKHFSRIEYMDALAYIGFIDEPK